LPRESQKPAVLPSSLFQDTSSNRISTPTWHKRALPLMPSRLSAGLGGSTSNFTPAVGPWLHRHQSQDPLQVDHAIRSLDMFSCSGEDPRSRYPHQKRMYRCGHLLIDAIWIWTYPAGISEAQRYQYGLDLDSLFRQKGPRGTKSLRWVLNRFTQTAQIGVSPRGNGPNA
jgi:hypothetical protein